METINNNFSNNKKILLASQSPRRKSLIKKLNIDFATTSPSFEENLKSDDYSDEKIKDLSIQKGLSVINDINPQNTLIISADTVVVLNNKILGKPQNEAHAKEMLQNLSGKKHFVVTAITILDSDTKEIYNDIVKTFVTFCDLSENLIDKYIKEKKPLDKAGSYGIQEMGPEYIKEVDGDLENVIGLSTIALKRLLIKAGYSF